MPGDVRGLDVVELGCGRRTSPHGWPDAAPGRPGWCDSGPARVRPALSRPVRHFLPAHRGLRRRRPVALAQLRPGHLRARRQLVVRSGSLGTRGCQAAATGRQTGLPHHQHLGHLVLSRARRPCPPRALIAPSYGNRPSRARFADSLAREVPFADPPVRDRLTGMSCRRSCRCIPPGGRKVGITSPAFPTGNMYKCPEPAYIETAWHFLAPPWRAEPRAVPPAP